MAKTLRLLFGLVFSLGLLSMGSFAAAADVTSVTMVWIPGGSFTMGSSPKRGGSQTIPSLPVHFAFKRSPLDQAKVSASVTTDPVKFTVLLPPGAEGLGSVISARNLKVEETWQPELGKDNNQTRRRLHPDDHFQRAQFARNGLPAVSSGSNRRTWRLRQASNP